MIPADLLEEIVPDIVKAGIASLPKEAVGLLCPDGTIVFLTNEAESQGEFLVSGEQLQAAFFNPNGVDELGFGLLEVAIWHTHPSGFVGPSKGDIESRRQPILNSMEHLVIALPNGEATYY